MKIFLIGILFLCSIPANAMNVTYIPANEGASALGKGLGLAAGKFLKNRKLKKYIQSCNDPLLDALSPQDAMKVIIKKNIMCPGPKK